MDLMGTFLVKLGDILVANYVTIVSTQKSIMGCVGLPAHLSSYLVRFWFFGTLSPRNHGEFFGILFVTSGGFSSPRRGPFQTEISSFQPLIFSRYVSFWGCICLFWREMIVEFFWVSIFWCHFLKSGGACNKTWSLSSYISPKQNFLDLFVLWTRKIAGKQSCKGSLVGESSRNSLTFWEFKRII